MNVLSLFDGMSCGRIALERAGIPVTTYFASEVDKYAIQISKKNWPDIVQLGDVRYVEDYLLPEIDLLIGGSPCQGFSFAGKGLNFEDPRSKLFFEFVRLLEECKPKYFLLENVKMKKEHQHVISEYLGCEPIMINSALVSAQNRRRLYWTNIPNIDQPEDKGIFLKDILEPEVDPKYLITEVAKARILRKGYSQPKFNPDKTGALNTKNNSGQLSIDSGTTFIISDRGLGSSFITNTEKIPTLSARRGCSHDNTVVMGCDFRMDEGLRIRDNGKTGTLSARARNDESCGQMVLKIDIFGKQKQNQDKASCLCGGVHSGGNYSDMDLIFSNNLIRRLTPIECERLQTVPDNYTASVSDSQRYKMLGNGWNVDTIVHILKNLC